MTDLEKFGLSSGVIGLPGRYLICTVDFEAFTPSRADPWMVALRRWAQRAGSTRIPFSLFLSVEDCLQLRAQDVRAYEAMGEALTELQASGSDFFPHGHRLFDGETGETIAGEDPATIEPYRKRRSMYFDVVHRHNVPIALYMKQVISSFNDLLADWSLHPPSKMAFRAGGWDYGSTPTEVGSYLQALRQSEIAIDSSASGGHFGESSWRLGAPFGRNVFGMGQDLIEVAPSCAIDCGQPSVRQVLSAVRENPGVLSPTGQGALVIVLHFDHLFHIGNEASYRPWALTDVAAIEKRVDRLFRWLEWMPNLLRLAPRSLGNLATLATGD